MTDMKVDLSTISEYKEKEVDCNNRVADLDTSTATRDAVRTRFDGLRKERLDGFMAGFSGTALLLKEMFTTK